MPTFVINTLGHHPQRTTLESSPVSVGRDAASDLVLPGETVSRQHAVFLKDESGAWSVGCVSTKNPLVVNGVLTTSAAVTEGTEILVGSQHLLIFSENEQTAKQYMAVGNYVESECPKCHWKGLVGVHRRVPSCPRCGVGQPAPLTVYKATRAPGDEAQSTERMSPEEARQVFSKLHAAKRSFLQRIEDDGAQGERKELVEHKPLTIGRSGDAGLELRGLAIGGDVRIAWDGGKFVAESSVVMPAMKLNGAKCKSAPLRHGDVLEIGSNRFRYVTDSERPPPPRGSK